jgi:hypothetical protein
MASSSYPSSLEVMGDLPDSDEEDSGRAAPSIIPNSPYSFNPERLEETPCVNAAKRKAQQEHRKDAKRVHFQNPSEPKTGECSIPKFQHTPPHPWDSDGDGEDLSR